MASGKPNWDRIKAEYLRGGTSYRKLAEKHGIPARTVERRAKAESWVAGCRQAVGKVSAELPGVVADVVLDDAARVTREHLGDLDAARAKAASFLAGVQDVQSLKDWASAYKTIQQCQRLALGLEGVKPAGAEAGDDERVTGVARIPEKSDDWRGLAGG